MAFGVCLCVCCACCLHWVCGFALVGARAAGAVACWEPGRPSRSWQVLFSDLK